MFIRNFFLAAILLLCTAACTDNGSDIYGFSVKTNKGETLSFSQYKGNVLLIVNTASKCGFTPQYDGLEALYRKYAPQGFCVIGFPCDQFGHQEPGSNEEIEEFCRLNHGVTFPLMEKSDVNGEKANDVFKWLYSEKPFAGFGDTDMGRRMDAMLSKRDPDYASNPDIKWNFTKFLIDREGHVIARFEPVVTPEEMEVEIKALLQ